MKNINELRKETIKKLEEVKNNLENQDTERNYCDMIIQFKNKYNTTILQMKIDKENKTYCLGQFKIGADKTLSRKKFYNIKDELIENGYKQVYY